MNNRVRHLDLRLSLSPELRAQSWTIAEQLRDGFVSEIVERIAERLHAQFGADALIEIPLLEVRWEGKEQVITDFDYARGLGDEVADELLAEFDTRTIDRVDVYNQSSASGGLRVYRSQAHKAAVVVSTTAQQQQRSASIANLAALEQAWQTVCEQGSASVAEAVRYICELEAAETVVESLSATRIQAAVAVCPLSRWPQPIRSIVASRLLQAAPEYAVDCEQETQTERPATTPLAGEGQDVAEKDIAARGVAVPPVAREHGEKKARQETKFARPEPQATSSDGVSEMQRPATRQRARQQSATDDAVSESQGVTPIGKDDQQAGCSLTESVAAEATNREPSRQTTHYAGLVYVLNLIMRIELPEILWCCGIVERSFLFDLCLRLAGSDAATDPVALAISGLADDRCDYRAAAVPDRAWGEVLRKVHMRLHGHVSGSHYRFGSEEIDAMVETPRNTSTSWSDLVNTTAILVATAFLDMVQTKLGTTIGAYLNLDGLLTVDAEQMKIVLPMEAIDIDVRRAALDVNPGYLQWQERTLVVDFAQPVS